MLVCYSHAKGGGGDVSRRRGRGIQHSGPPLGSRLPMGHRRGRWRRCPPSTRASTCSSPTRPPSKSCRATRRRVGRRARCRCRGALCWPHARTTAQRRDRRRTDGWRVVDAARHSGADDAGCRACGGGGDAPHCAEPPSCEGYGVCGRCAECWARARDVEVLNEKALGRLCGRDQRGHRRSPSPKSLP